MTAYIQREMQHAVERAQRVMPVIVITGMRQTGKTTFLQGDTLFKRYRYYTLDDFATLNAARANPDDILSGKERICIDEAHKAPELFSAIKRGVDRMRTPGQFVLSGSANFSLLKDISESLAGRAIYLTLHPFSHRELTRKTSDEPLLVGLLTGKKEMSLKGGIVLRDKDIRQGGMPSVRGLTVEDQDIWFRGFEQTYVERDIRDIARIDDLLGFRNLIRLAALRNGQLLNLSQLSRDARLTVATTTRYLELAETSFLFRRLPPFLRNRSSRLIKSPKLYLSDSGIASHLAGADLEAGSDEPLRGVLYETYVLQNISALLDAYLPESRISYWHVQGRHEVDFVLEHKRAIIAIEVKAAQRWAESDLLSLRTFLEATPACRAGILAYNGNTTVKLGEKLWAVPLGTLLS